MGNKAFNLAQSVVLAALAVALLGCSEHKESLLLQREWTANAEYAGDIMAAAVATSRGIEIRVREGSELLDPVRTVRVGDADFGVTSADRILRENEGGANLVILASATYKTPVVFIARTVHGLHEPSNLVGKTVGIQAGTNTELVFEALLKAANIRKDNLRIVESGWGIQKFLTGDIDVLGAFAYDETVQLEMQNVDFTCIDPDKYVTYVGTVYFTRKELVENDSAKVQLFMDCLVAGWHRALNNPSEAMQHLKHYQPDIDLEKESKSFEAGKAYFQGEDGNLLHSSKQRWETMGQSLISLGRLKSFVYADNIDYSFLDKAITELGRTQ